MVFLCLRVCLREISLPEIRLVRQQDPVCLIKSDKMNRLRAEENRGVPVKHQDRDLSDTVKWLNKQGLPLLHRL